MLCLHHTTLARGSEGNSWQELEVSRCSRTLSSARFSQNSSGHSGRPRDEFPHTSSLIISLLVAAGCSVGVTASFDEDVREVGEDELDEVVERPGTTKGYNRSSCHF